MIAALRLAFQALFANKLRSALTMLGNIIGVTCVVALINIGLSGRQYISSSLAMMGENLVCVYTRNDDRTLTRPKPLTIGDAEALVYTCPSVKAVTPMAQKYDANIVYGNLNTKALVRGVWASGFDVCKFTVVRGAAFTDLDVQGGNRVCVLGDTIVQKLFGNLDPLGQKIRIENQMFTVIGTLEKKGATLGEDQDNQVIAPFSCVQDRLTGQSALSHILVTARSRDEMPKLKEEILACIRVRHHVPASAKSDVKAADFQGAEMVDKIILAATGLLASIAFISLLVGGIGIMNIMLVAITERTREIGLRMAVGATDLHILFQFLIEAVVMSAVGGMIGVLVGIGLSVVVTMVLAWPMILSTLSVIAALGFSAAVGLFFGIYPAWRASRLDPMVAIRMD